MKEFLLKTFGFAFGSSVVSFIARSIIALLMLYTGSATSFGDAVGIMFDKDRSIAAAVQLINETPEPEITHAVIEEKKEELK